MTEIKQFYGNTTEEIWQYLSEDLTNSDLYDYKALLVQDGKATEFVIDIDLGGGFEGGFELISFKAPIASKYDFRFAIHHLGLIDAAGKFFGLEDVIIGYPEFDDALMVKTSDQARTRQIFADEKVRKTLQALNSFTLHLTHSHQDTFLELVIEEGVNDIEELRDLYDAFYKVLLGIEAE